MRLWSKKFFERYLYTSSILKINQRNNLGHSGFRTIGVVLWNHVVNALSLWRLVSAYILNIMWWKVRLKREAEFGSCKHLYGWLKGSWIPLNGTSLSWHDELWLQWECEVEEVKKRETQDKCRSLDIQSWQMLQRTENRFKVCVRKTTGFDPGLE